MDDATTERIAREFHEVYERLAPEHGWKSQTPVAWDHLPLANKLLMLAVVRELPWIKEQALKLDSIRGPLYSLIDYARNTGYPDADVLDTLCATIPEPPK